MVVPFLLINLAGSSSSNSNISSNLIEVNVPQGPIGKLILGESNSSEFSDRFLGLIGTVNNRNKKLRKKIID